MQCPYCSKEMVSGHISALILDGSKVYFDEDNKIRSVFDVLSGEGRVTAAKYTSTRFLIDSNYCESCQKMIIDTGVS